MVGQSYKDSSNSEGWVELSKWIKETNHRRFEKLRQPQQGGVAKWSSRKMNPRKGWKVELISSYEIGEDNNSIRWYWVELLK